MHIHLLCVQEVGSGLRAPEEEEDWEQLLGDLLQEAARDGEQRNSAELEPWRLQALLCQGAKAHICMVSIARRERRAVVADPALTGDRMGLEECQDKRFRGWG